MSDTILVINAGSSSIKFQLFAVSGEGGLDRQLKGLYRVDVGEDHYAFTQFEATSARYAFPSFDEPRWKTPFDVRMHVPSSMRAFGNTHELSTQSADGETTVTVNEPRPK